MKKLLIGLFAVVSVASLASGGYNVYIKGGVNFYGNKESEFHAKGRDEEKTRFDFDAQKAKLEELAPKVTDNSLDTQIKYMKEFYDKAKGKITFTEDKYFIKSYNLALEGTKSINNYLEVGLGVAYKINKDNAYTVVSPKETDLNIASPKGSAINKEDPANTDLKKAKNGIRDLQKNILDIVSDKSHKLIFTDASFNSIPIYATAKFNFGEFSGFKPYAKADLGYALNVGFNNPNLKEYEDGALKNNNDDSKYKLSNGIYLGGAVGTEYKNFLIEVAASYIPATLKVTANNTTTDYDASKFNIGVNAGYKFSL